MSNGTRNWRARIKDKLLKFNLSQRLYLFATLYPHSFVRSLARSLARSFARSLGLSETSATAARERFILSVTSMRTKSEAAPNGTRPTSSAGRPNETESDRPLSPLLAAWPAYTNVEIV